MRNDLHANLTVRIFTDRKCFGPGVAELLRRVRELHSLRAAAMSMNMAYSKAWTVLRTAQEDRSSLTPSPSCAVRRTVHALE